MEMGVQATDAGTIKPKMQFTGKVTKISLAGALVDIGTNQPAVMHISQMVTLKEGDQIRKVEDVLTVGQEITCWVRRVRENRVELTMIKPLALEWRDIKSGMTVKGNVVRLEKFGAFIEIGAERPGLVHVSELSHEYVRTPGDVVKEGDEVEAQVLEVDRRKKQIKLSMKALQPLPEPVQEPVKEETHGAFEGEQRGRGGRHSKQGKSDESVEITRNEAGDIVLQGEPELTAMEIAWREAQFKAKSRRQEQKARRKKSSDNEQDDILYRTLEHKSRSGQ
jgi:predicted RNA-binding protein with RPS1 domain